MPASKNHKPYPIELRTAHDGDSDKICDLIRRSITQLCAPDHLNDTTVLKSWLANKTAANVRTWVTDPESHVVVAHDGPTLLGVGAMHNSGFVTLNYVHPGARFQGISKSILNHLEEHGRKLGLTHMRLESTQTAHTFYRAAGYTNEDTPSPGDGTYQSTTMIKHLGIGKST